MRRVTLHSAVAMVLWVKSAIENPSYDYHSNSAIRVWLLQAGVRT